VRVSAPGGTLPRSASTSQADSSRVYRSTALPTLSDPSSSSVTLTAQADNAALYERVRFVEGYAATRAAAAAAAGPVAVDVNGVRLPPPQSSRKAARYSCGPFAVAVEPTEPPPVAAAPSGGGAVGRRRNARYVRRTSHHSLMHHLGPFQLTWYGSGTCASPAT
jgi:hypothetical protein